MLTHLQGDKARTWFLLPMTELSELWQPDLTSYLAIILSLLKKTMIFLSVKSLEKCVIQC